MPTWEIVGLPDATIRESKERVRTAIKNSGIELKSKKYIINLSPVNIKKDGSILDLSIAVAILKALKIVKNINIEDTIFVGELSLNGDIKRVNGILPICIEAMKHNIKKVIVSSENYQEANIVKGLEIIAVNNLLELINYLNEEIKIENPIIEDHLSKREKDSVDFSEVKGQENIKRALEISASGGHNLLMIGPPRFWKNNDGKKNNNNITRIKL